MSPRKNQSTPPFSPPRWKPAGDLPFTAGLSLIFVLYITLILGMLYADWNYTSLAALGEALRDPNIAASIRLTAYTCSITTLLSVMVAVPIGYLLSRYRFPGKNLLDAVLDIPIVLPPLVIGLSLLILFNQLHLFGQSIEEWCQVAFGWIRRIHPGLSPGITYKVPAVILAQFTVSAAFAVRTMRNTFDQISPRQEQVALTLGCSRGQAFWNVVLPEAWRGVLTAGTLAWARALGEFGPILVFAGATRGRTEVLSTSVFLEISVGNLEGAVAVSILMVLAALAVLLIVRSWGTRREL